MPRHVSSESPSSDSVSQENTDHGLTAAQQAFAEMLGRVLAERWATITKSMTEDSNASEEVASKPTEVHIP